MAARSGNSGGGSGRTGRARARRGDMSRFSQQAMGTLF